MGHDIEQRIERLIEDWSRSRHVMTLLDKRLGFLADVVTATEAPRKQAPAKPGSSRRRALAQVPPELRQSIDEAAREIVKRRRQRAKNRAKTRD